MTQARSPMLILGVVLLVAGCSTGGGNAAVPTTAKAASAPSPASVRASPTPESARVAAEFGKCAPKYPSEAWTALNLGVSGLDTKLVPVKAVTVRVCRYAGSRLHGAGVLTGSAAIQVEREANGLPSTSPPETGLQDDCGLELSYDVTFAAARRSVTIRDYCAVDGTGATNGVWYAMETQAWRDELQRVISADSNPSHARLASGG